METLTLDTLEKTGAQEVNWACLVMEGHTRQRPRKPSNAMTTVEPERNKDSHSISDEGPKDGDPSQQADDITSIKKRTTTA